MLSMVTGRTGSESNSNTSDGEKTILRWTTACLTTTCPIFSRNPQFNMIYCPVPSLLMYVIITLASENAMTKTLHRLFELTDSDVDEIREMAQKLAELQHPKHFYCFIRFLVDEQETTTVSKELMIKSNDVAFQQVFASFRPSRITKFLNSLTFSPVSLNRPSLLTTNGYGSAGLNATWIGKTRKAGLNRFACTYHKKKNEEFFEIRTAYRTINMEQFQVFEIPFKFGLSSACFGSLLILRPHLIGSLPYANRQLTTQSLSKMLDELYTAQWITEGRLLLPQFSVDSCHDLWKNLMRHGVQPDLGQSQKAPPMASLWHWAHLRVGSEGIRGNVMTKKNGAKLTASQKALQNTFHNRVDSDSLLKKHQSYAARIDSPFTYLVMVQGIPIFTGSYFGAPPPKSTEIFINAPERIRHHRTYITKHRRYPKETRKQKLMRRVRKSEDREKEKDKKRARKEQKNQKVENLEQSTTASSTSSLSSPEITVSKKPEIKNDDKSKSKGWRHLANRIFKRKN
ncbi:SERPIN domain-containing protein [Caenorhabditis elegans]|nr:SERPIN domain-containing protein [Caenorhabditis elegans]CBK19507.1 SERPIN domain-containing protein [Caenorhabditis elegans]|eukprot:NP_001255827.1 Uncharacterized protein CELE_Y57G11C.5 [Caenorhabditis elegans]